MYSLAEYGCRTTVASQVHDAILSMSPRNQMMLWFRMMGMSYRQIGIVAHCNKGTAWRVVHGPVKCAVYSILEKAVYS